MRLGYRRVSSIDQNLDRQLDGITIDKVFDDKVSGKDRTRPQLELALAFCREGDTLVVHSMDRLARNLADLLALVKQLTGKGVTVEFIKERLTFTGNDDALSVLLMQMLGAVAEFERSLILSRQREGIAIARAKGVYKGRRRALTTAQAKELRAAAAKGVSKQSLADQFGISRESVYAYIRSVDVAELTARIESA